MTQTSYHAMSSKELKRYFTKIRLLATDLVVFDHVFWEVQAIIRANPAIQKPNSFYEFIGHTYSTWSVSRIRMLMDENPRYPSLSLVKFLKLLIEPQNDRFLSRKHYRRLYYGSLFSKESLDQQFDKIAGDGQQFIPKRFIEADIARLLSASKTIKRFTDKRIAHYDQQRYSNPPRFRTESKCIKLIEVIILKYQRWLFAISQDQLLPTWQYDWKKIFAKPWIINSAR